VRPVYELTLADAGSRLEPDPYLLAADPGRKSVNGSIHLRNTSVDTFAGLLSLHLHRPVFNKTNMPGLFRFVLDWSSTAHQPEALEATTDAATAAPSILQAVQEQLGLRLTPGHGRVEVIVIDRAQKPRP
jgi:uncharacterized protein (TIGR03435 family)